MLGRIRHELGDHKQGRGPRGLLKQDEKKTGHQNKKDHWCQNRSCVLDLVWRQLLLNRSDCTMEMQRSNNKNNVKYVLTKEIDVCIVAAIKALWMFSCGRVFCSLYNMGFNLARFRRPISESESILYVIPTSHFPAR